MIALQLFFIYSLTLVVKSQIVDVPGLIFRAKNFAGSEHCASQLEELASKFLKEEWAIKMIDASSKLQSGLLMGNIIDLGHYDECLEIEHHFKDARTGDVRLLGKYCLASMVISVPASFAKDGFTPQVSKSRSNISTRVEAPRIPLSIGSLCLPDACQPSDLMPVIKSLHLEGLISLNDGSCHTKEIYLEEFDGYAYFGIVFFSIVAAFMVLSTVYDVYLDKTNQKPAHVILLAFSVLSNGKKLISTKRTPGQMTCLHGLRVISMMWVILGHLSGTVEYLPAINALEFKQMKEEVQSQFIHGAHLAVDTFLFITGLLITYTFIKSQSKIGAKFNLILFYVHRYLRLTPTLLGMYIFVISVMKYTSSGPMGSGFTQFTIDACLKWWWSVFLYVQNYVNMDEVCMVQTWYISMDMQLFILSPIILIPLVKWRKSATYVLWGLLAISIAISAAIAYTYKIQMFTPDYNKYYNYLTHTRMAPYLIGMLLGVYLYENENKKVEIHWALNLTVWLLILSGMGAIVFTGGDIIYNYDRLKSTFYLTLHKSLWAVGLSWIVFASLKGYGGIVNWFLSLPLFQVLARLTYSMYLMHIPILMIVMIQTRTPNYITLLNMIHQFWGDFIFVLVASTFWVLAFESPMIVIEKVIFGGLAKPKEPKKEDHINEISIENK